MAEPQQPLIAWHAATVGQRRLQPGDITSVTANGESVLVRVVSVQPGTGGAQVGGERITDAD